MLHGKQESCCGWPNGLFLRWYSESVKGAVERIMLWHRLALEICKLAQSVSVRDRPLLDPHRTRERRTCCGVNPLRPVPGLFKPRSRSCRTASIIASWSSRKSQMLCSSGSSEMPCCSNSQSAKLICGFAVLGTFSPPFFSKPGPSPASKLGDFARQPDTAVPAEHARYPTLNLGNQFLGNVQGKAASLLAAIEDITGMLLPGKTREAIRTDAGPAAKTERAEGRGPQVGRPLLQPALDVGKGFRFRFGFCCRTVCLS